MSQGAEATHHVDTFDAGPACGSRGSRRAGVRRTGTRAALRTTLAAFVVLGFAGCGSDDSDGKTVTVAGETVTAPAATTPSESSDAKPASAGPPLPAGVIGIDGAYLLESGKAQSTGYLRNRFVGYEEQSNATTTCAGGRCSVRFRLGLASGGFKPYNLKADPERPGTYIGTGAGQAVCTAGEDKPVPTRERIAARGESVQDIGGRKVAGRLSVFITVTAAPCGTDERAKDVSRLQGPRQG